MENEQAGMTGKMKRMSKKTIALMWGNLLAFVAMIGMNAAADLVPLGGVTTAQVSEAYPTLFTPVGITFSIWGLIYTLMAVFVVYQLGVGKACFDGAALRRDMGPWFIISCAMNILWLLCWHFGLLILSLLFMAGLLISVATMACRTNFKHEQLIAGKASVIGIQLYFGWIVAATIANVSVVLVSLGWDGAGMAAEFWTVLMLMAAICLGVALSAVNGMPIASIAVVWAFAGIVSKHAAVGGYNMEYPIIIAVAVLGMIIVLTFAALEAASRRRHPHMIDAWE